MAVLVAALAPAALASPPGVILFQLGDDYGFNNVGFPHGPLNQGNPEMKTPTMDKLAIEGVRLERHYVYKFCSPTRSSFLTGRLPIHVNQNNACNDASSPSGADLRMTLLPAKLKQAGYTTAIVGKWHCGARSAANLPVNRGFDFHLGFLKGGEDHFHQNRCAGGPNGGVVDLWTQHAPARGLNDTYSAFLYSDGVLRVIHNFTAKRAVDPSAKLFVYLPWHNTHDPLEAPDEFMYPPYYNDSKTSRLTYNAMARALDSGMGNTTDALRAAGLWNETLTVFSADNGGWLLPGGAAGSNNWPLRGGKVTDFEGGVRSVAFMSGGYVPENIRGSRHYGYISVADWYATFCTLAGVDPNDHADGVPDIDSIDVWSSLLVPNTNSSPRTRIPLSFPAPPPPPSMPLLGHGAASRYTPSANDDSGLIVGRYKIICGSQAGDGFWQGPVFPNSTGNDPAGKFPGCVPDCCLFDIVADESETTDLRTTLPSVFEMMTRELEAMGKTVYQTNYAEPNTTSCITNDQAEQLYGGFIGPMCFKESPFQPTPPPPPPRRFSLSRPGKGGTAAKRQCLMPVPNHVGAQIVAGPCSGGPSDATWAAAEGSYSSEQGWIAHVNVSGALAYIKLDEHNGTTRADFCRNGRVYLNPDAGAGTSHHQGFVFNATAGTIDSTTCDSPQYKCLVTPSAPLGASAHGGACDDADATGWVQTFVNGW